MPRHLILIFFLVAFQNTRASHIVGGEVTYVYLGDSSSGSIMYYNYKVSLSIYEDCINGQPEAIAQDNPAFLGVFDAVTGAYYEIDSNVNYAASVTVPNIFTTPCGNVTPTGPTCLLKKTFIKTYALPSSVHGYVVSYQRCCRNAAIVNVNNPGNDGCTYYCIVPPTVITNTSAVFKNYPPQTICLNVPLRYDNSATDADGDSLSYGFCAALKGATNVDIKPYPSYPDFGDSVQYLAPYSSVNPISGSPSIVIDPVTGIMSGTPNRAGRYLVTVFCDEWRAGVLINTIKREFQFIVTESCNYYPYAPIAGTDTLIMIGDSVQFYATGGKTYSWTPATYLTDASISNPVGYFPVAGVFTYTLHENSDSGCSGTATRTITVLDHAEFIVPNAFTPNDDGRNDVLRPLKLLDGATLENFKIFNRGGKMVYSGGPADPGWNGFYKGVKQDLGVYYWEILYTDNKGVERKQKGDVTLVR